MRSVKEIQADLDAVNGERDILRARARVLSQELDAARTAAEVAAMPDSRRRALQAALSKQIAPTGIASEESVGTPGAS